MAYLPYLALLAFPVSLLAIGVVLERQRWLSRLNGVADRVIRTQRVPTASQGRS